MTRKINDEDLLRMAGEGIEQKEIARRFGCAPPSISKRLKQLRAVAVRPAVLDALTPQQERYVMEVAAGKNQTQAALAAYECGSLDSAKTLGSRLAKNEVIQEAITAVMETEGLTRGVLVKRLKDHVEGKDASVSLKAVKTGLELHDAFPASKSVKMNINVDASPVDLSKYRNR